MKQASVSSAVHGGGKRRRSLMAMAICRAATAERLARRQALRSEQRSRQSGSGGALLTLDAFECTMRSAVETSATSCWPSAARLRSPASCLQVNFAWNAARLNPTQQTTPLRRPCARRGKGRWFYSCHRDYYLPTSAGPRHFASQGRGNGRDRSRQSIHWAIPAAKWSEEGLAWNRCNGPPFAKATWALTLIAMRTSGTKNRSTRTTAY
jgi:hypothetical protein